MTQRTATIGSISTGTLRTADLIESFAWELKHLAGDEPTADETELLAECDAWADAENDESAPCQDIHEEQGGELVDALIDALQEHAPPYMYFGACPGDGSDFGFWLPEDFDQDFDGLKVSDTSEVPDDYCGEVLHVNDHGNVTLYAKDEGSAELREIWGIV